jgi:hypothetical protein
MTWRISRSGSRDWIRATGPDCRGSRSVPVPARREVADAVGDGEKRGRDAVDADHRCGLPAVLHRSDFDPYTFRPGNAEQMMRADDPDQPPGDSRPVARAGCRPERTAHARW